MVTTPSIPKCPHTLRHRIAQGECRGGRIVVRPVLGNPIDLTDALIEAIAHELCKRGSENDVLNRLEAEVLLHQIAQGGSQGHSAPAAHNRESKPW